LSTPALDDALTALTHERGSDAVVDLRADAFGHGASEVESRAAAHGVRHFVRDGDVVPDTSAQVIYGFDPQQTPLLSLQAEVVAVKSVPAGTAVSYGYTYRTSTTSTLALVGLGYADGVPRSASNRAHVRIGDRRGIVAGRIAMDQLVVDLGDGSAAVGDLAVLWEDASTMEQWCNATARTAAALTTRLGPRIHRVWSSE
jgi:alanine racemase